MVRLKVVLAVFLAGCLLCVPKSDAAFRIGKSGPKVTGFTEVAFGGKLGSDTAKRDDFNLFEERVQLRATLYPEYGPLADWMAQVDGKGDFTVDQYYDGKTDFDLRELSLLISPLSWMDIRVGRQVLTWGTGDYLFINDPFPKDYISFYIGRDDEYLKKPSDSVKISLYSKAVNFDIVAIPFFEPNTLMKGDRLSFFDTFQGGIAGRASDRHLTEPGRQLTNTQWATRAYRNIGSYEVAVYTFRGFDAIPRGYLSEMNRELFYPRLDVYGASIRGPFFGGIASVEAGYSRSQDDPEGNNRLIENSRLKYMAGYEKDLGNDWRVGVQYLFEQALEYDRYWDALLPADFYWDQYRHVTTLRVGKLFKDQTVKVNFFAFFSPSDMDGYLRPSVSYKVSDSVGVTLGVNLAWGRDDHTEFGQMERNKNVYLRLRYSF